MVLVEEGEKGLEGTGAKNVVTALGRVTGNVTECPNAAKMSRGRVTWQKRATYACSRTSRTLEERSWMKYGTAPALMTTCVCSDVPDAMSADVS